MSAAAPARAARPAHAPSRPTRQSAPQAAPRLRLLPAPVLPRPARTRAPKAPFVILVGFVLAAGLVGLLLLNTVVDQDAFRLQALQSGQNSLDVQEAQLRQTADEAADPAALAAAAAKLGMIPAGPPQFVRGAKLPKGKRVGNLIIVLGAPTPAAIPPPAPVAATSASSAPVVTPTAAASPTAISPGKPTVPSSPAAKRTARATTSVTATHATTVTATHVVTRTGTRPATTSSHP